ncbi:hypothetical protein L596_011839 [Steinernema carpocapsae]|uniref:PAS domain-containing protein n=2 Tax=Steinernema carpocapsae TaxID=34508 RepID=A0A4U5NW35_STECR|nr:hypothetical protein L596_011839 [Steinernema carpocapsae]
MSLTQTSLHPLTSQQLPGSASSQQRSTRGASKQRRDQINVEIYQLRDLLPLSSSIKDRLFQLQVMSLACIFIRKDRYLPHILRGSEDFVYNYLNMRSYIPKNIDSCRALKGFLMMVTQSGKLLYISENASEYLGHSVEEIMCQGDQLYDLIDDRDHDAVHRELNPNPKRLRTAPEEGVFICRMNLSRTAKRQIHYHKFVLVHGRYVHTAEYYQAVNAVNGPANAVEPIFAAYCQPLINPENAHNQLKGNTSVFQSRHHMDMRFIDMDHVGQFHFGYSTEELENRSWYSLIHPSVLFPFAYKHRLIRDGKDHATMCLLKLQTKSGDWIWTHAVVTVSQPQQIDGRRQHQIISVTYQILSEREAATLQMNDWIYSMRHTTVPQECYVTKESLDFAPSESDPLEFSPSNVAVPPVFLKTEPHVFPPQSSHRSQISVEIPSKPHMFNGSQFDSVFHHHMNLNSLLTPEYSSPEGSLASASTHISNISNPAPSSSSYLEPSISHFCPSESGEAPLPELDDVEEYFRQVDLEQETSQPQADLMSLFQVMLEPQNLVHPQSSSLYDDYQRPPVRAGCKRHHSVQMESIEGFNTEFGMFAHPRGQKRLASWAPGVS